MGDSGGIAHERAGVTAKTGLQMRDPGDADRAAVLRAIDAYEAIERQRPGVLSAALELIRTRFAPDGR